MSSFTILAKTCTCLVITIFVFVHGVKGIDDFLKQLLESVQDSEKDSGKDKLQDSEKDSGKDKFLDIPKNDPPRYMTALYQTSKRILSAQTYHDYSKDFEEKQTIESIPSREGSKYDRTYDLKFEAKSLFNKYTGGELLMKVENHPSNIMFSPNFVKATICFEFESICFNSVAELHKKRHHKWHAFNISHILPMLSDIHLPSSDLIQININLTLIIFKDYEMFGIDKPQLIFYTNAHAYKMVSTMNAPSRPRRSVNRIIKRSVDSSLCQLQPWKVDFSQIGMTVFAPKKFDSNYCSGECPIPLNEYVNATNHALIRSSYRAEVPHLRYVPSPCCASAQLEPLTILFDEDTKFVLVTQPEMVVKKCGCL